MRKLLVLIAILLTACSPVLENATNETTALSGPVLSPCNESEGSWDYVERRIADVLNASNESFTVDSCSAMIGRGGYFNANVTLNGSQLKVYYRSGWCSSGGSDCGYSLRVAGNGSEWLPAVQQTICPRLYYRTSGEDPLCSSFQALDITNQTRAACLGGKYSYPTQADSTAFYVVQESNRCASEVIGGRFVEYGDRADY